MEPDEKTIEYMMWTTAIISTIATIGLIVHLIKLIYDL